MSIHLYFYYVNFYSLTDHKLFNLIQGLESGILYLITGALSCAIASEYPNENLAL